MIKKKRCGKCNRLKPLGEFSKDKIQKGGLRYRCKDCDKVYYQTHKIECRKHQKKYNQRHKVKFAKRDRKYYQKHKPELVARAKKYRQTTKGDLRTRYRHLDRRCNNPEDAGYKNYGGRGIKNLFKSFNKFFIYVTIDLKMNTYEKVKGLQIDRIENDGHYEVGNIQFVTAKANSNNRRKRKKKGGK